MGFVAPHRRGTGNRTGGHAQNFWPLGKIKAGDVIPVAVVKRSAGIIISAFRERVLSIPGKIAASCEMRSRGEVEEIVRAEVHEALEELSRPILSADPPSHAGDEDAVAAADDGVEK
jgi:hypothetical protein